MHDPTEHVQEHIQHTAVHGDHDEHNDHDAHSDHAAPDAHHHPHAHEHHGGSWITAAALTAAILAALAAISGMLATSTLTNSTHKRIDANDLWSYYQAKSIKSSNVDTRLLMAQIAHMPPLQADLAEKAKYEKQLPDIQRRADNDEKFSEKYLEANETFESAETLFHISIAIVAIAVVAKRRAFWYISLIGGVIGAYFFVLAIARIPSAPAETSDTAAAAPAAKSEAGEKHAANAESPSHKSAASAPAHTAE